MARTADRARRNTQLRGFLRRHGAAPVALATVLVLVGAGAQANTGDPLILGTRNTATSTTSVFWS